MSNSKLGRIYEDPQEIVTNFDIIYNYHVLNYYNKVIINLNKL